MSVARAATQTATAEDQAPVLPPQPPIGIPDSSSEGSLSDSDDLVYHLKEFGLSKSDAKKWGRAIGNAGYYDMDELKNADVGFEMIAKEIKMPSGLATKFVRGMQGFKDTGILPRQLPQGNLDGTAPRQTKANFNWAFFWGVTIGCLVVGGAVAVAVRAATLTAALTAVSTETAATAAAGGGVASAVGGVAAAVLAVLADCLDGDSEITMADRSKKKIKDVKAGDKILTYNNGKLKIKTILEVKTGSSTNVQQITLQAQDGRLFQIKATGGHPFFTEEHGWAVLDPDSNRFSNEGMPSKLQVGDSVVQHSGLAAKIVKIWQEKESMTTYNLVINGQGTFFVNGVLSHSGLPP